MSGFEPLAREAELNKLMLKAASALRRGEVLNAKHTIEEALALDENYPEALELLGEINLAVTDYDRAEELFRRVAFDLPEVPAKIKALAETKLGETALEKARAATRTVALEEPIHTPGAKPKPSTHRRSPGGAAALSLLIPGLGEIYAGARSRGVLILGVFVLLFMAEMFTAFSVLRQLQTEIQGLGGGVLDGLMLVYVRMGHGSGLLWLVLDACIRLFSAADAVLVASRDPDDDTLIF